MVGVELEDPGGVVVSTVGLPVWMGDVDEAVVDVPVGERDPAKMEGPRVLGLGLTEAALVRDGVAVKVVGAKLGGKGWVGATLGCILGLSVMGPREL